MFISELIGALIAQMVEHGDITVVLDQVPLFETQIRGFYVHTDEEFNIRSLVIEPIER